MITKKCTIRIVTFFSILLFLLMSLLSSPVAAAFTENTTCDSENKEDGPVVSVTIPPGPYPIEHPDQPIRTATFNLHYTFVDDYDNGYGSEHYAILYIEQELPDPDQFVQNTLIQYLNPGEAWLTKTLTQNVPWSQYDECLWHVHVSVGCRQYPDGEWVEDSNDYHVSVNH